MKLRFWVGAMAMVGCLSGCSVFSSQSWKEKQEYRYQPPATGTNVGRWIPVSDGTPSKPKPKKKKAKAEKREQQPVHDETPAPPVDRFR
jgi:hypothetical protein